VNRRGYVVAKSQPVNLAPASITSAAPVAVTSAPTQENKTILQLASEPDMGADIEIDGNFIGQTPSRVELVNGDHTLRLTMRGFAPWERKLHATGGTVSIDAQMNTPTVYRVR
jgi:hypothetical protein